MTWLSRIARAARVRGNRPGSVLAVVAVSLVALVAVIALAIDIGMLFAARGEAQRAADAAALAGASAFIDIDPVTRPADAQAAAMSRSLDYATRMAVMNTMIEEDWVTRTIIMDSQRVRVAIRRPDVPLFFARIFGIGTRPVAAVAAAEAATAGSSNCVKPFAIPDMWNNPTPASDIYRRAGDPPIWDFDAHLRYDDRNPPDWMRPHCSRQGQRYDCPPEAWALGSGVVYDGSVGLGTGARDGIADAWGRSYTQDRGRRMPIKIQQPGGGGVPSWWFAWRLPGSAGASDLREAIRGCVDNVDVGQGVTTETGMMSNPIYNAFIDLIDNGNGVSGPDRNARWDETCNCVVNSAFSDNINASPRVMTVALVNPQDIASGMNTMRFVDFATFFLEDPRVVYPNVNPAHQAPITARFIGFASGTAGPEEGSLVRRLRLVQ